MYLPQNFKKFIKSYLFCSSLRYQKEVFFFNRNLKQTQWSSIVTRNKLNRSKILLEFKAFECTVY